MKKSAADDLYDIVIAPKSMQKYQEIYRLIVQLAVMAAANSKTEMTPCGHVFPDRDIGTASIPTKLPSTDCDILPNCDILHFTKILCL